MGKAAICNPYLDTLGGGERYSLSLAGVLVKAGWEVDVEWKDSSLKEKLQDRFGLNLKSLNFVADTKNGSGYDLCFWISDGSIPLLHSRKNILHFQVPFHDVEGGSLWNRMKLFRINKIVCNSKFTKAVIDKEYKVDSLVVYPPVDVAKIKAKRKEDLILYVGRFSELVQSKRQDVLIAAFKKFSRQVPGWKLILAGGSDVGGKEYLAKLKKQAKRLNVEILENISYKQLVGLYGKAKFFWSAAGFGVNEKSHPERLEHFGVTTVEAMAAGALPLVFNAGGAREIVKPEQNGLLWESVDELVKKTGGLLEDKGFWRKLSAAARESSASFNSETFSQKVLALLS